MSSVHSEHNPLGQISEYPDTYDAGLLFPIDRDESWRASGQSRADIPFYGVDIWNAYEVSWLNTRGKPVVCIGEFRVPATSANLVESKSFKLYLNSYNQTRFASLEQARAQMQQDLSVAAGAPVEVILHSADHEFVKPPAATCIDDLDVDIEVYQPDASLLKVNEGKRFDGWLCSHLLKSNCPVTGQPDWGTLYIHYRGAEIAPESLLAYVVSLRQHQDFHEQCVERTYRDLLEQCRPESLTVYARYVRRGGLDINPCRTSEEGFVPSNFRSARQ